MTHETYLLPRGTLLLENHSHNSLYFKQTPITSDLFIPSMNLALEYPILVFNIYTIIHTYLTRRIYQGEQHVQSINYFGDANLRVEYDKEKKKQLENLG